MKKILTTIILLISVGISAQNHKSDIEKAFSNLKWVSPNNDYQRFGYDPKTFTLKMKKLSDDDPIAKYIHEYDVTFIGTYKTLKFYFAPGLSEDPTFYILNSQNKQVWSYGLEYMCVNSAGIIYVSGNAHHMFNTHRKFKIKGESITEVKQPYLYVGINSKLLKPAKLYSQKDRKGNVIANLPKGYKIEVLLATQEGNNQKNYLVKTAFGLVGWLSLDEDDTYLKPMVEGLRFHGG